MKKKLLKTSEFEKCKKYAMTRRVMEKIKGGNWYWINGELVWIE